MLMWREALTLFDRGNPDQKNMQHQLRSKMTHLFLAEMHNAPLSPHDNRILLAFYSHLRELVPVGLEGDVVIEMIGDRAAVIGMDVASTSSLSRLMQLRLQGSEKSRMGAKVAAISLLFSQPESAIKFLNQSVVSRIDPELEVWRRWLRAYAEHKLGNYDKARKLLAGETNQPAQDLLLDIALSEVNPHHVVRLIAPDLIRKAQHPDWQPKR